MEILDRALKPHPDAMVSKVGDEAVILHLNNATYYGLDETGLLIWEQLQVGLLPREICRQISNECNVKVDTVEVDTQQFLEELLSNDLLIDAART